MRLSLLSLLLHPMPCLEIRWQASHFLEEEKGKFLDPIFVALKSLIYIEPIS